MAKGKMRRGIAPAVAVGMAVCCCWTGLVRVDRRIRAVTINQSPPLWEAREEGDLIRFTLLGRGAVLDLGPVRRTGRLMGAAAAEVLSTPSAPERLAGLVYGAFSEK